MTVDTLTSFTDSVLEYLVQPFRSVDNLIYALSAGLRGFIDLNNKIAWPYLLSGVVIDSEIGATSTADPARPTPRSGDG